MPAVRVIGSGRAGQSLLRALTRAGWTGLPLLGRGDDPTGAAAGTDLLVLAVPDGAVAEVAGRVDPVAGTVVAHLAGSLGLDVLARHPRRAALHPLVSLPSAEVGARRLEGAWFAVAGDPLAEQVVADLGGRTIEVADGDRARYHAAAVVAANHVVALMGQVERLAAASGLPLAPFVDLARGALENCAEAGPAAALTGPVARGDWATVARHLAALDPSERPAYRSMAVEAARLAGRDADIGVEVVGACA